MSRILTVGAAQLGPNARNDSRKVILGRLLELMRQAHDMKCDLIVYPELALTSFFPRWWMEDQEEIDSFFEHEMPSRNTLALFEEAKRCRMGFYLGFAERTHENNQVRHYNASIVADQDGRILGYNTPSHVPWMPVYDHLTGFHNHLVMQSGAYQNSTFVIGVAKAGFEEGCDLAGGSCIIAPSGE